MIYSNSFKYQAVFDGCNQKFGTNIKIEFNNRGSLFPSVNIKDSTIRCNPRLNTILLFYNLSYYGYTEKAEDLTINYFLLNKYLSYNYYDYAQIAFENIETSIDSVIDEIEKEKLQEINSFTEFQSLFVLFHEFYHVVFGQNKNVRIKGIENVKAKIKEIADTSNSNFVLRTITKPLITEFDKILSKEDKLEEFACDMFSWNLMINIMINGGFSLDEILQFCSGCILTLYYLENIKLTEDVSSNTDTEYYDIKNRSTFDSLRIHSLEHVINLFLENERKGYSNKFQDDLSKFEKKLKFKLIGQVLNKFRTSINLSKGANLQDKIRRNEIENKLVQLDNKIINSF